MKIRLSELKQIIVHEVGRVVTEMSEANAEPPVTSAVEEWRRQAVHVDTVVASKKPYLHGQWRAYTEKNEQTGRYRKGWEATDPEIGVVRLTTLTMSNSSMSGRIKVGSGKTTVHVELSASAWISGRGVPSSEVFVVNDWDPNEARFKVERKLKKLFDIGE
jgi:hypothetical protein